LTVQKEIPRVYYTTLQYYGKAVALGDDGAWYLIVDHAKNRWGFKLIDEQLGEQLTSWMTVKRLEELRQPRKFKVLRKFLADRWGKDLVDIILEQVLLVIENNIDEFKKTKEEEEKEEKDEFDAETRRKAMDLLTDPAFFYKLGKVLEWGFHIPKIGKDRFVIGEERNKRLLGPLLIGASKLGMTSIIKLLGDPGTAKDTMVRMWLQLLKSAVKHIERSFITAASMRYSTNIAESDLIYIPDSPELRGETGRHMRFMRADDGGLISEYAMRDPETGEMITKTVEVPVKGVVTTSNAITGDTALESGMWTLTTNSDPRLTRLVKLEKLKLRAGKRQLFPEDQLKIWQCAFHILLNEDLPDDIPKIPYAEELIKILGSERSESRRDPDKLCDLIALIAWMRRFQKPFDKWNEADLVDLYIALQIGLDAITETISELDKKEQMIYQVVREAGPVSCRLVSQATGIPYKTCYRYLDKLIEKGFIVKDKEGGRNIYSILEQKTPKTLLIGEGRNNEKPDDLMRFILSSFPSFSLSHGDTDIIKLIDPITGDKVAITKNSDEWKINVEPQEYEFPYCDSVDFKNISIPGEKVRSSETDKKQASLEKQGIETFLPSEMRNENKPEKERKVDSSVSGPIPLRGPVITFKSELEKSERPKKPSLNKSIVLEALEKTLFNIYPEGVELEKIRRELEDYDTSNLSDLLFELKRDGAIAVNEHGRWMPREEYEKTCAQEKFERPRKRVLGRGCYDCKHFTPEKEVGYIAGRCKFRGNMTDPAINTILRQGCEWFEFKIQIDESQGIQHWDLWKEEKHSELGSLQDKINAVLDVLEEMQHDYGVAKRDDLTAWLSKERDIPPDEAEEILGMLIREGKIFEPRPGYLKKT